MDVLFINACVREESRTKKIADYYLKKLGYSVAELNLEKEKIEPLYQESLKKRDELLGNGSYDDEMFKYARQFANAQYIVIAAPYWDFSFPASLKSYIERINAIGITFSYNEKGEASGLCKAKKLVYITTCGGYDVPDDFGFEYIKRLCNSYYGINDVELIKATGLDIVGNNVDEIIENTINEIGDKL